MTKDNKQQKLSDSTEPAIAYSECYAQVFSRLFFGDCLIESDKIESGSVDLILTDLPYGTIKGQGKSPEELSDMLEKKCVDFKKTGIGEN